MATKAKMTEAEAAEHFEDGFVPDRVRDRRSTIGEIEEAVHARQRAEDAILAAVRRARQDGVPWTAIAAGLGVSHQAAMKRYRDQV